MKITMDAEADVIGDVVIWLAVYDKQAGSQSLMVAVADFPGTKEGDKFTVTIER